MTASGQAIRVVARDPKVTESPAMVTGPVNRLHEPLPAAWPSAGNSSVGAALSSTAVPGRSSSRQVVPTSQAAPEGSGRCLPDPHQLDQRGHHRDRRHVVAPARLGFQREAVDLIVGREIGGDVAGAVGGIDHEQTAFELDVPHGAAQMENRAGLLSVSQLFPGIRLAPGAAAGAGGKKEGETRRDTCHGPYAVPSTSFRNRGLFRSGSKFGSIRSQAGER